MIKNYDLTKSRIWDFYQSMANVKTFLSQEDAETLQLSEQVTDFNKKFQAFDEALKPLRKSGLTDSITFSNTRRSDAIVGFAAHCRHYAIFPDKDKAAAASSLLLLLEKYGKSPQTKPVREVTALVNNLLQDLDEPSVKEKITKIGAELWISEMRTANAEFEKAYNERTQSEAAVPVGETKQARSAMYESFKRLVQVINAWIVIKGETDYKRLSDNLNQEIKQAQQIVKQRLSGASKEKPSGNSGSPAI